MKSELFLYISCLLDKTIISCQICFYIPSKLYRISNNISCPITRNKFTNKDIVLNYEKNELLDIFIKYQKLKIKTINCNIIK